MWKVIILSAFLSICQAAKISDIYGTYTTVVGSSNEQPPKCIKLSIAEDPRQIECTCSDGNNSTLVEIRLLETLPPQKYDNNVLSLPIIVVGPETKLNEAAVMSLCNVECDCGGKFNDRRVVKVVNENYSLISYVIVDKDGNFRKQNYLLARSLPSAAELEAAIKLIDTEKDKNAPVLCTQEIYYGLRPSN